MFNQPFNLVLFAWIQFEVVEPSFNQLLMCRMKWTRIGWIWALRERKSRNLSSSHLHPF